jgi:hypothetical protein
MDGSTGTVVQLPPPAAGPTAAPASDVNIAVSSDEAPHAAVKGMSSKTTTDSQDAINANIHKRNASREERKRELLIEARKARIDWILGSVNEDAKDLKEVLNGKKNPLRELQACASEGISCAPDVVEALLSSKLEGSGDKNDVTARIASEVKRILETERLSWENVSSSSNCVLQNPSTEKSAGAIEQLQNDQSAILTMPPVPQTQSYNLFLQILCQSDAADVVFSMQKFCKTIEEAARVMLSVKEDEKLKEKNAKYEREKKLLQQHQHPLGSSSQTANGSSVAGESLHVRFTSGEREAQKPVQSAAPQHNNSISLAKAVRGFINTTFREVQSHDAFKVFSDPKKDGMESDAAKDELFACIETFVFMKCHKNIYNVLGAELETPDDHDHEGISPSTTSILKTADEVETELQDKMKLLQFVTPEHLEIKCLKMAVSTDHQSADIVDLSESIDHLRSMKHQSSPRLKLRSILLAHRGVNASLNAVLGKQKGGSPSPSPPSADDVLPTLILAVLRAQPDQIVTDLRFIEFFAAASLLRGEAGYAYTNLCGAVQFLRKLDMEGHAAEVSLGGLGEGAVLSISPDDFKAGMEQSRKAMKLIEDNILNETSVSDDQNAPKDDTGESSACNTLTESLFQMNISGRDIREARANGETISIEWALKRQKEMLWQHGRVPATTSEGPDVSVSDHNLPPEEPPLPSRFNRTYSFLATHPDDIRINDLPKLLSEYRMLVHATESLMSERSSWRESEKKRQMQLSRSVLERDYNDVIHGSEMANGTK